MYIVIIINTSTFEHRTIILVAKQESLLRGTGSVRTKYNP